METDGQHIKAQFNKSRKLGGIEPSPAQLDNISLRLQEIFTTAELENMDSDELRLQIERVWPIAKYVDDPD